MDNADDIAPKIEISNKRCPKSTKPLEVPQFSGIFTERRLSAELAAVAT